MNNKKVQYINLLLPTILYFVLFMLEVVIGHGITKALFTVYFIVFIIKNEQQFLAVKVKDGIVHVYWQNRK